MLEEKVLIMASNLEGKQNKKKKTLLVRRLDASETFFLVILVGYETTTLMHRGSIRAFNHLGLSLGLAITSFKFN